MFCDKMENIMKYAAIMPQLGVIAGFMEGSDLLSLAPGRYEINESVFVNVEEYAPGENQVFEAHREYIDLQYIVSGNEEMDFIHLEDAVPYKDYDPAIDAAFYHAGEEAGVGKLFLCSGSFAVFWPEDPHRPGVKYTAEKVKKLIFKIKVNG